MWYTSYTFAKVVGGGNQPAVMCPNWQSIRGMRVAIFRLSVALPSTDQRVCCIQALLAPLIGKSPIQNVENGVPRSAAPS